VRDVPKTLDTSLKPSALINAATVKLLDRWSEVGFQANLQDGLYTKRREG
jgi:hypothetical protein